MADTARWVTFREEQVSGRKTKVWLVYSKDGSSYLGKVEWWAPWRKYTFKPAPATVFEEDCLHDIAEFVQTKTVERRAERAAQRAAGG